MGDKAGINRSLNTVRTELEYLRDSGVVSYPQFQSIMAQLPPQYAQGNPHYADPMPTAIAQAAQDPNNPANPKHPRHSAWASNLGKKLGNAALFGAGATAGSDLVNSIF
ncbi:hypothetical protein P7C71_g4242, partial [Lecanoromycetidae sp. Uapishka_2]